MGKQTIWCLVLCQCLWFWGALTLPTLLTTLQELDSTSASSGNKIVTDNQIQNLKVPDTTTAIIADTPKPSEITHNNGSTQYTTPQALKSESMSTQVNEPSDPVQDKNDSRTTHLFSLPTENGTSQKNTVVTSAYELESTTGVSMSLKPSISTGDDKIAVIDNESDKEVLPGYTTKHTVPPTTKHDVTKTHGISDDTGLKISDDGLLTTSTKSNDKATGPHSGINHGRHTTSPMQEQDKNNTNLIIYIIPIFIVLLVLAIIVILALRKKRRSRSQNFSKRVKKGDNKDVWAGQMPELAEGKLTVGADELDNGMAVSLLEDEQEMTTFVSGEKKADSGIEIREAEAEANKKEGGEEMEENAEEEQKVTKEAKLEVQPNGEVETKEEQFPLPPVEQDLVGNEDKAI